MINKFFNLIKVYDTEYTKVRVGNKEDGGYVVAKELAEKTDCVYSFGIGDDISFEEDFCNEFNPEKVRCFDHTIEGVATDIDKIEFNKLKLSPDLLTRDDIYSSSLLKIDVEWDEWDFFSGGLGLFNLFGFNQIIIELHIINPAEDNTWKTTYFTKFYKNIYSKINNDIFRKYYFVLNYLLSIFTIVHIHGNNSLIKTRLGGYEFPPLLELTLVRSNLIKKRKLTKETFPIKGLDYPNKTDRPDFESIFPFKHE